MIYGAEGRVEPKEDYVSLLFFRWFIVQTDLSTNREFTSQELSVNWTLVSLMLAIQQLTAETCFGRRLAALL